MYLIEFLDIHSMTAKAPARVMDLPAIVNVPPNVIVNVTSSAYETTFVMSYMVFEDGRYTITKDGVFPQEH